MVQVKRTRNTIRREVRIDGGQHNLPVKFAGVEFQAEVVACPKKVFLFDAKTERQFVTA